MGCFRVFFGGAASCECASALVAASADCASVFEGIGAAVGVGDDVVCFGAIGLESSRVVEWGVA